MPRQSLRQAFGEPPGSLQARAASVGIGPSFGVWALIDAFNQDVAFAQPLVTADLVGLGGEFQLVLKRNGDWRFSGQFEATGLASYAVSLVVTASFGVANTPPGSPAVLQVAFAATGEVNGALDFGSATHNWDQSGNNALIAANWSRVRSATIARRLEHDADLFGVPGDIIGFIGEIALANGAVGAIGAGIVLAGEAAGLAGIDEIMLPGLVGLALAGGVVYFAAPGLLIPAFIAGALATPLLIKQDALSEVERDFARTVFGDTIPYDRVIKTNLLGAESRPFAFPLPGNPILLNLGDLCYDNSTTYDGDGDSVGNRAPGQLFIHELAHAWQIAHSSFTPCLYCRGVATAISSVWGASVYSYGAADVPWGDMGIEQQAQVVSDWFAGNLVPGHAQSMFGPMRDDGPAPATGPPAPNPYFRYIREHIRAGVA